MWVCILCRFEVATDDAELRSPDGWHCICLHCYLRLTGTDRAMPPQLRREVIVTAENAPYT